MEAVKNESIILKGKHTKFIYGHIAWIPEEGLQLRVDWSHTERDRVQWLQG